MCTKIGNLILHKVCYTTEFGSFGAIYVKVVEDRPYYSLQQKCSAKNRVLAIYDL